MTESERVCLAAEKFALGLPTRRRERDSDWECKVYRGKREDGSQWEKVVRWFGFRLHLIVDALYELPIGAKVTKA